MPERWAYTHPLEGRLPGIMDGDAAFPLSSLMNMARSHIDADSITKPSLPSAAKHRPRDVTDSYLMARLCNSRTGRCTRYDD
ncbi:hypothetical protein LMH87_010959 [Akanthomyces muscarius]|uniref:Uncharacterized protein n=1 Tax=Akanthomyces muscarius TaxID=2231603 RepID=A0A9W8QAE0_AKAMU|nr:hypothetical protein LMH87_010959 [Akanthomyces muscarius]KAJ4150197.1 hypothetical protein LMH87_010959 [Akanthomyces muscarius]